ncbi:hypothetical protein E2F46_01780 [Luteimonas aestuarii]|uniref:Uncharacterized protein n=1 Tax=Luteimonas aestuarii TaxID=453837 RepID=A0A4R5U4H9_9GAMM|nr:hypothetical protein [Luteimonas aestuarii]TDK28636.1 hypothetical protein E2F46_01780 [Luteimonas aestuarii]
MNISSASLCLVLLLAPSVPTFAQSAHPEPGPSLYAVNSAAISAAMTYCMAKYGPLTTGSRSAACFSRARNVLADFGLREKSVRIDQTCNNPSQFNTCITPEIGRFVIALNAEFGKQGL